MKRLIIVLIIVCLLMSGCGVIREDDTIGTYVPTSKLDIQTDDNAGRVEKSAVYFLNKTGDTLTAEIRILISDKDANPAEIAVRRLLEGPSNTDELLGVAPPGMSLDYIEFSRDIANVYLLYNGEPMKEEDKFILELALANTVTDILQASYISVFYNGIKSGFFEHPFAPHKKHTGSIKDAWLQVKAKLPEVKTATEETMEAIEIKPPEATDNEPDEEAVPAEPEQKDITTILYFISENGEFILPEVRKNVVYTDDKYIESLIRELKKGPHDTSVMKSPLADDVELLPVTIEDKRVTLDFSKRPTMYEFSSAKESLLSYAAIIYTITGFVPGIERVDIAVQGQKILSVGQDMFYVGMHRKDFKGFIGSSAPIYLDYNKGLLLEVPRSMEQQKTWSAKERVLEIIKGPLSGDPENAGTVKPLGVTEDDILSVDVYGDTAFVNLSQNFKDACIGFSARNEMLLVYSIVNTVTAMDGINKVQFLVEGEQTDKLAGTLCLSDPFLKNYGIIKQGS